MASGGNFSYSQGFLKEKYIYLHLKARRFAFNLKLNRMKKTILFIIATNCSLYLFAQVQQYTQLDKPTRNIVLNSICNAINNYYVFPDTAKLMCNYIRLQDEKGEYDL